MADSSETIDREFRDRIRFRIEESANNFIEFTMTSSKYDEGDQKIPLSRVSICCGQWQGWFNCRPPRGYFRALRTAFEASKNTEKRGHVEPHVPEIENYIFRITVYRDEPECIRLDFYVASRYQEREKNNAPIKVPRSGLQGALWIANENINQIISDLKVLEEY